MKFGKSILGLRLETKMKVDFEKDLEKCYENMPLCIYGKGACICKRQLNDGSVKCFYRGGPEECCFEKEQPISVLEKSKS